MWWLCYPWRSRAQWSFLMGPARRWDASVWGSTSQQERGVGICGEPPALRVVALKPELGIGGRVETLLSPPTFQNIGRFNFK